MILGISIGAFTILHVIITLVAIGSGLIVVGGMFASHRLPVTTALFLFTTALTSLTGFLFPIHGFTPALGVGIVATVILLIALFALYKEHLVGAWRWIYVEGSQHRHREGQRPLVQVDWSGNGSRTQLCQRE
jgi:hypothetical protein